MMKKQTEKKKLIYILDGLRVNIFEQIFIFGWTIQLIIITYLIIINNEYIISIIYLFI